MSSLEIAVILPNYQRRESLLRAFRSVSGQSEPAAEVVVVDDGSTEDLTRERELVAAKGAKWLELGENRGPAAARNAGVQSTSAPWIAFLDSDDFWDREKLSEQAGWHRAHPGVRISQVAERWVRDGKPVSKPPHWEPGEGNLFGAAVQRCVIGPSCVMMHRSLFEESGGFDPRFRVCEDYALWLEICRREWVGKVPGPPRVTKVGGRVDQLSHITPAMDRFRVVALLELLRKKDLVAEDRRQVISGIRDKCDVLARGAEKRGNTSRAETYLGIARSDLASMQGPAREKLIEAAWREIGEEKES